MNMLKQLKVGRRLGWLLLSFGILISGVGVLGTGFALALTSRDFSDSISQFVPSLYYVGMTVGSLSGRYWLRWCGAVNLFVLSAIAASLFCVLVLFADTPFAWGALRALQGFCMAGIYIGVEVVLNTDAVNRFRGRTVAFYQVVTYTGMAVGQWVVGRLGESEVAWFTTASALFVVGAVIAGKQAQSKSNEYFPESVDQGNSINSVECASEAINSPKSIRLGLYVAGVAGVLLGSFYTVFPVVMYDLMGDISDTGNYLAATMLAALPSLLVVARYADHHGRKKAMIWVSLVMTVALLLLMLSHTRWMLWSAGLVYSGLVFCVYGLGVSDVNDRVDRNRRESAAVSLMVMFSIGGCMGPWVSGWAYAAGGALGYFVVSATAIGSMLAVCLISQLGGRAARLEA